MDARDPRGEDPRRTDAVRGLQFLTVFATGGTERQVINLAYGLDRARFDLHVACFKRWGDLLGEIEGSGWPLAESTPPADDYGANISARSASTWSVVD